jgi:hypothetical protein
MPEFRRRFLASQKSTAPVNRFAGFTGSGLVALRDRRWQRDTSSKGLKASWSRHCRVRGVYDRHESDAEKKHAYELLATQIDRIVNPQQNVIALTATSALTRSNGLPLTSTGRPYDYSSRRDLSQVSEQLQTSAGKSLRTESD